MIDLESPKLVDIKILLGCLESARLAPRQTDSYFFFFDALAR